MLAGQRIMLTRIHDSRIINNGLIDLMAIRNAYLIRRKYEQGYRN